MEFQELSSSWFSLQRDSKRIPGTPAFVRPLPAAGVTEKPSLSATEKPSLSAPGWDRAALFDVAFSEGDPESYVHKKQGQGL